MVMTEIIIKKRRKLTLKKSVDSTPEPLAKPTREELDRQQAKESNRIYFACRDWIMTSWPEVFDKENIKPLAIGIDDEIREAHRMAGGVEVLKFGSCKPVKKFLGGWVKRKGYLKAMAHDGSQRFNLSGETIELVSPLDREHAKNRLESIKNKTNLKTLKNTGSE